MTSFENKNHAYDAVATALWSVRDTLIDTDRARTDALVALLDDEFEDDASKMAAAGIACSLLDAQVNTGPLDPDLAKAIFTARQALGIALAA